MDGWGAEGLIGRWGLGGSVGAGAGAGSGLRVEVQVQCKYG